MTKDTLPTQKKIGLSFTIVSVAKDASGEVVIEGFANTSTKDRVGDVVLPSAFSKSLPTYLKNPVLLANHDWNDPCGKCMSAEIQEKGLYIKARVSDTRQDIKTLIREGVLSTFSIGYNEVDTDFDESTKTKYIKELELLEISIVTVPANTESTFKISPKLDTNSEPLEDGQPAKKPLPESIEPMPAGQDAPGKSESKIERHQGESEESCVSRGIATLINEGKDPDQAAAIAYSMCGEKAAAEGTKCTCGAKAKTAKQLGEFIGVVRDAMNQKLTSPQIIAVCDYFNTEGVELMTKEQLITALRGKSADGSAAPAPAATPAVDAAKADPAKPADGQPADASKPEDAMKEVLSKLDTISQALAQLLDLANADQSEDQSEDQTAADQMSPDDAQKELDQINAEIQALEDSENA